MKEFCYSVTSPKELWKQFIEFCAEHELGWNDTVLVTYMSGDEDKGSEELANETHRKKMEKAEDEALDLF